jgi:exonuclease III
MRVKNLLRQWKVDIFCLQETKLEFISRSIAKNLWGCPYVEWCYVPSRKVDIVCLKETKLEFISSSIAKKFVGLSLC